MNATAFHTRGQVARIASFKHCGAAFRAKMNTTSYKANDAGVGRTARRSNHITKESRKMADPIYTPPSRGNKAPSEKHLEDWLVVNYEKLVIVLAQRYATSINHVIARQPRFPSGIPDIIVDWEGAATVIELKKGVIDYQAVAQIMRYIDDLRKIAIATEFRAHRAFDYNEDIAEGMHIPGILIGSHVLDKDVLKICHYSDIHVFTYTYNDGKYTFNQVAAEVPYSPHYQVGSAWDEWAHGVIGNHFLARFGYNEGGAE